jgi:hypothetical protein
MDHEAALPIKAFQATPWKKAIRNLVKLRLLDRQKKTPTGKDKRCRIITKIRKHLTKGLQL